MLVDAQKIPAGTCDLYFFGGIFGSGKSTLCQTLSRLLPGTHLKASELIGYVPNQSDPTGKSVREVLENQERLVSVLADLCTASANVLLDGHFCLLDEKSAIVRIPVNFFKRIHPTALVLVESGADEVLDRQGLRRGALDFLRLREQTCRS